MAKERLPEVTCYLCKRTFQKRVEGAAHRRNYYRCAECLTEPEYVTQTRNDIMGGEPE